MQNGQRLFAPIVFPLIFDPLVTAQGKCSATSGSPMFAVGEEGRGLLTEE